MCGIFGYISHHEDNRIDLKVELSKLNHRGPDDTGFFNQDNVFIGHTRLSIIDIDHARQPMRCKNNRFILTYNGEIYNYKELKTRLYQEGCQFETDSDTEILLQGFILHKEKILNQLNGMYAFAVFDTLNQELFLARDPMGIKPLYYLHTSSGFFFASEIKGLKSFASSTELNLTAMKDYLKFGYVASGYTLYSDIMELKPGEYLVLKNHTKHIYRHIEFTCDETVPHPDYEKIQNSIDQSIKRHLIADVPFGVFLSGGVDSSYILSQMHRHLGSGVPSFTVGFGEPNFDETKKAQSIARHFQSVHHSYILSEHEFLEHMDEWLSHTDQPQSDPSMIATYFLSHNASAHVKMVLSGEGSDELFFGYRRYRALLWSVFLSKLPFKFNWTLSLESRNQCLRIASKLLASIGKPLTAQYYSWISTGLSWHQIFNKSFMESEQTSYLERELQHLFEEKSPLKAAQSFDLTCYLPSQLLKKVDMASMKYGLEVRVPFLETQLIHQCITISSASQVGLFGQKKILRHIMGQNLPQNLICLRKKGFSIPLDIWFRKGLKKKFQSDVLENTHRTLPVFFNMNEVRNLFQRHSEGSVNVGKSLWIILVLNHWMNHQDR